MELLRVCLINPTYCKPGSGVVWPPLGLGYIAAVLEKAGHDVTVIDTECLMHRNHFQRSNVNEAVSKIVQGYSPQLLGITSMTPDIPDAYDIAHFLKPVVPEAKIIIGGTHTSALPFETLSGCGSIDAVVVGEGEETMLELASGKEVAKTKGLVFRSENGMFFTGERAPVTNLDRLPFPARHLLDMEVRLRAGQYRIYGTTLRTTTIITSRGCSKHPRCAFCCGSLPFGQRLRFHSPEYVMSEIEELVAKYRIEGLYFADDQFLADKRRVKRICELMMNNRMSDRVKWAVQARPDSVDREILNMMKRAGCVQIEYGFESGSQRMLDMMDKGTTVKQNYQAAHVTEDVGIRYQANIIFGMPTETRKDIEETLRFLDGINPFYVNISRLIPIPGSTIWKSLEDQGLLTHDWTTYHTLNFEKNFTRMSKEEFDMLFLRIQRHFSKVAESKIKKMMQTNALKSQIISNDYTFVRKLVLVLEYLISWTGASSILSKVRNTPRATVDCQSKEHPLNIGYAQREC